LICSAITTATNSDGVSSAYKKKKISASSKTTRPTATANITPTAAAASHY
jgi:hypothetical protein